MSEWTVRRKGLRYIVERIVYSNFAGSRYEFARDEISGTRKVRRFWLRRNAQAYADGRNATSEASE